MEERQENKKIVQVPFRSDNSWYNNVIEAVDVVVTRYAL